MRKKILLVCLLFTVLIQSQTEYREGFVITKEKDTVYGELDYRADKMMAKVCKFREKNKVIKYGPEEIFGYRFVGGKFFVSKKVDNDYVFLQLLIEGKLTVYYMEDALSYEDRYFVENDADGLKEISYEETIIEMNGVKYVKESKNHLFTLHRMTEDAPELSSDIDNIEIPSHRNLVSFAKKYHEKVCKTQDCIVYESKPRKVKIYLEPFVGVMQYVNKITENGVDNSLLQAGALLHFSIPSLGDKWYVKTGIAYHKLKHFNEEYNYYKVPIHIEYIHFKGVIRPLASYGIAIGVGNDLVTTGFNLGVNVVLKESMFLSFHADLDFSQWEKFGFFPEHYLGTSFNAGLFFKL